MLDWRLLALVTPLAFVSYQAFSKLLPKGTSVFLVNAYASLVGLVLMLGLHFMTAGDKSVHLTNKQFALAIAIGIFISLGNLGIIKAYSLGAPQSLFTLFFYVALIVYGIIVGVLLWQERLNLIQVAGMLLAVTGVVIAVKFKKS